MAAAGAPGLRVPARDPHRPPWESGPFGEYARDALRERLPQIREWTSTYLALAAGTHESTWVPTHGEPHTRNQLATQTGTYLVDWESAKLAPRERDLAPWWSTAGDTWSSADPTMLEMFDLEWRLDEISQYAAWFEAPHTGNDSDEVALAGLHHELRA